MLSFKSYVRTYVQAFQRVERERECDQPLCYELRAEENRKSVIQLLSTLCHLAEKKRKREKKIILKQNMSSKSQRSLCYQRIPGTFDFAFCHVQSRFYHSSRKFQCLRHSTNKLFNLFSVEQSYNCRHSVLVDYNESSRYAMHECVHCTGDTHTNTHTLLQNPSPYASKYVCVCSASPNSQVVHPL